MNLKSVWNYCRLGVIRNSGNVQQKFSYAFNKLALTASQIHCKANAQNGNYVYQPL
jgi:hypothetical protein